MSKRYKLVSMIASCCETAADNGVPIFAMSNSELAEDLHNRSICGNYDIGRVQRAVRAYRRSNRYAGLRTEFHSIQGAA